MDTNSPPRLRAFLFGLLCVLCASAVNLHAAAPAETTADWHGYRRASFTFEGEPACVIAPKRTATGAPWIWKARFLDHRPDLDLALLDLGFHVAFLEDTHETLGSPDAIARYDRFYALVRERFGLAPKAALEGLSRGGLYVFNFAAAHPDKVACVYADGAVCDFKSWPAGKLIAAAGGKGTGPGSAGSWASLKKSYGFADDAAAIAWTKNPVDNLKPLADAKIPLFHVVGADDDVVPVAENTALIEQRYKALGGTITVVAKPGEKHAHGLADVRPLVEFVVNATCGPQNTAPVLKGVKRVVVLGDSITQGGKYIEYVESVLLTRYPERTFEVIGLGLASETVSGLSEEGHADGKFPRPDLHERLARALEKSKPDFVTACYGMNDGIYLPLDPGRTKKYQDGITRLVEAVKQSGAGLLLLTPPVFDPVPIKARTSPAKPNGPFEGYDSVLAAYADWLNAQPWPHADVHGPMWEYVQFRRKADPQFTLSKDGVHPGPDGHWFFAAAILDGIGIPAEVDSAIVEVGGKRISRGNVTDLAVLKEKVSFTWTTRLPMPLDPKWERPLVEHERIAERFNRQTLAVTGLPAARYRLTEDDRPIGEFTKEQLARGLDVAALEGLSIHARAAEIAKLVAQRQGMLKLAWLAHVGHKRPGIGKGLPIEEATEKAAATQKELDRLRAPAALKLTLVPIAPVAQ